MRGDLFLGMEVDYTIFETNTIILVVDVDMTEIQFCAIMQVKTICIFWWIIACTFSRKCQICKVDVRTVSIDFIFSAFNQ